MKHLKSYKLFEAKYYHGTDVPNIEWFEAGEDKFGLLGKGIYFYKTKSSAKKYGNEIYSINVAKNGKTTNLIDEPLNIRIMPIDYILSKGQIEGIFTHLKLDPSLRYKAPIGTNSPLWWYVDGWDYYGLKREDTANMLTKIFSLDFDGMVADYPNGGEVLVLWNKYDEIKLIKESIISPSTAAGTMSLWHGGNLDDVSNDFIQQKKGRYEYGPGLYLTTNYDTAKKYAKGSRKLYMVTIESGVDISEMHLDMEGVAEFVSKNVIVSKRNEVLDRMNKMAKDGKLRADIFNNILVNTEAIKSSKSGEWRSFLASKGVDYELVHNAFGWGETMVVLFNMKNIVGKIVVKPSDKIETWDLPTEFNK